MWNSATWNLDVWNGAGSALLTFEESLEKRLFEQTGYSVYPAKIPQSASLPAIVYTLVSRPHVHDLSGNGGLADATVQIDCWAETYSEARTIAEAVRHCLQGFVGTMASGGVYCACALPTTVRKEYVPAIKAGDQGKHRFLLEYEITYEVVIPSLTTVDGTPDDTPFEVALVAYLGDLVQGLSVYHEKRPQSSTLPCVVWSVEAIDYDHELPGSSGLADMTFKLTVYGTTYGDAVATDEVLRLGLDGYTGVLNGCDVLEILIDDDQAAYAQPGTGADQGYYSTATKYVATYRIDQPE